MLLTLDLFNRPFSKLMAKMLTIQLIIVSCYSYSVEDSSIYASLDVSTIVDRYFDREEYYTYTDLCGIMTSKGSDKGGYHNYTTLYSKLFSPFSKEELNVFELGLGTNNLDVPSNMGVGGIPGASLFGWADYFPNAKIYGADVDIRILFQTSRISTFYCDQTNEKSIEEMYATDALKGVFFDIIIEDGLHSFDGNLTFLLSSISHLKKGGIYIVEDLQPITALKFKNLLPLIQNSFKYIKIVSIPTDHSSLLIHQDNVLLVIQK